MGLRKPGDYGHFCSDGHSRMSLHATTLPRAIADIWLYQGPNIQIPDKILTAGAERRAITEANLNAPMSQYQSPYNFDKVNYDNVDNKGYGANAESGDWWV